VLTALDPLRELNLLRRRQQVDAPDVLEEQLERVGRRLEHRALGLVVDVRRRAGDDLHLLLLE
jgi:hypothetical protein